MFRYEDGKVIAETRTMVAVIDQGFIVSMKSRATGEEYFAGVDSDEGSAVELVYAGNEAVPVSGGSAALCEIFPMGDDAAELRFGNWNADGNLFLRIDGETGDLCVEPSAYSSRPGVKSVRYNVKGLRRDLKLVAPIYQGTRCAFDDTLVAGGRWTWPFRMEAGLVMAEGASGGIWAHVRDTSYRFKTLDAGACGDPFGFGLESDNYGPIENELSAGGLEWRFNVFEGDWRVPAKAYRDWLWDAYSLGRERQYRPDWLKELRLGVSWCPTDIKVLDAIENAGIDPKTVLLHLPNWRKFIYDQDYPLFQCSDSGREFVEACLARGFRVMPHCSSMEIDPSLEWHDKFGDFAVRELESGRRMGWSWVPGQGAALGVPESGQTLVTHKQNNVMIKIHTALPMWWSVLRERIGEAVDELSLENVFIDVTLCTYNARRSLVNGTTMPQGLKRELEILRTLGHGGRPLYIGGEGLNEVSAQGLSFAQAHLITQDESLPRSGECDLNRVLFGDLARTIGYNNLNGASEQSERNIAAHIAHGAIPTLTVSGAEEIESPNAAVAKVLALARE